MAQQTYGEWMLSNPEAPKDDYKMKSTENVTNNHTLTAVEWLMELWDKQEPFEKFIQPEQFEQAKQIEKEQIMKAARQCHFEGVRQSAKTSEEYIIYGQEYYNETYKK